MTILKIAKMGHPILQATAERVEYLDNEHVQFIEDMIETMIDADGTGLAAPQVHYGLQILVYFVAREGEQQIPVTALINPKLTPIGHEISYGWEGCLSVPGLRGLVPRWHKIRLQAMDLQQNNIDLEISGFHARVLQHEADHLFGYLYPQRMDNLGFLVYTDTIKYGLPSAAIALKEKGVFIPKKPPLTLSL